jgi:hypothetical protein
LLAFTGSNNIALTTVTPHNDEAWIEALLQRCGDVSWGSLWWVKNSLWREVGLRIGWPDSEEHPGVSLLKKTTMRCMGAVPMLFGTTSEPTPRDLRKGVDFFLAWGLNGNMGLATCFGKLESSQKVRTVAALPENEFTPIGFQPVQLTQASDMDLIAEFEQPRVWRNSKKANLSRAEQNEMEAWLARQSWLKPKEPEHE